MNKVFFIYFTAVSLILLSVGNTNAQFTFSVSPGLQINCAGFGYHYGNFVTYAGLQLINASYSEERTGEEYDYGTSVLTSYKNTYKTSETLYVPSLGTKYYFKTSDNLKLYGDALFTIFITTYKIEDSNNPNENKDIKDRIKKSFLYGGQLGFGTEYFFNINFDINNKFNIKLLLGIYEEKYQTQIYNPNTGNYEDSEIDYKYKLNVNPTYVKLSFNFYFNGSEE